MPEGPEVRRQSDQLAAALVDRPTTTVWFAFDHLAPIGERLTGLPVRAVSARGKAFLLRFPGGLNIYAHHQLYGRWRVVGAGRRPPTRRQLRVVVENSQRAALLYSASDIEVLSDEALPAHPYLRKLGPDILDPALTVEAVSARLADPRFARRGLAALYLDQGFLAGNGNYLRSEMLFVGGVHPRRKAGSLDDAARFALAEATVQIARRAYTAKGVTNDPRFIEPLRSAGQPRRVWRHFVFGREGRPCFVCDAPIVRIEAAGRRLYLCARCQT